MSIDSYCTQRWGGRKEIGWFKEGGKGGREEGKERREGEKRGKLGGEV